MSALSKEWWDYHSQKDREAKQPHVGHCPKDQRKEVVDYAHKTSAQAAAEKFGISPQSVWKYARKLKRPLLRSVTMDKKRKESL